jgi:hypothetical protein
LPGRAEPLNLLSGIGVAPDFERDAVHAGKHAHLGGLLGSFVHFLVRALVRCEGLFVHEDGQLRRMLKVILLT